MKKNILYLCLACMTMGLAACSTDPEDAVSKHVYGENEAPYLRIDTEANIACTAEFREGHIAPITISLKDYAEKIQTKMGMTVDDLLAGVDNGSVVFYNINPTKTVWDKTAPNYGTSGWGYDKDGKLATESVAATIELDKTSKALIVKVPEDTKAGLAITENVGFAINNGKDFDDYVRFNIPISVTNPGLVIANIEVSSTAYDAYLIEFSKSQEAIEKCLGISYSEFLKAIKDTEGDVVMYMVDNETEEWDTTSSYTANGLGYWLTNKYKVCTWGSDGYTYYAETDTDNGGVNIGHIGVDSGTKFELNFVYAMKADPQNKFIQFKVTATVE